MYRKRIIANKWYYYESIIENNAEDQNLMPNRLC